MAKTREERIRERAYEIWRREGAEHGRHADHWLRAENEIDAEDKALEPAAQSADRIARGSGATGTPAPEAPMRSRPVTPTRSAAPTPAAEPEVAPKRRPPAGKKQPS